MLEGADHPIPIGNKVNKGTILMNGAGQYRMEALEIWTLLENYGALPSTVTMTSVSIVYTHLINYTSHGTCFYVLIIISITWGVS